MHAVSSHELRRMCTLHMPVSNTAHNRHTNEALPGAHGEQLSSLIYERVNKDAVRKFRKTDRYGQIDAKLYCTS